MLLAIDEGDSHTDRKRKPHAVGHTLVIKGRSPAEKSGNEVKVRSDSHEDRQYSSVLEAIGLKRFVYGIAGQGMPDRSGHRYAL
jgi:hypothetical protein